MSGSKLANDSSHHAAHDSAGKIDQPLGLTVHSMPSPEQALGDKQQRTVVGRWKMLAVLLVCAAPVIASYFMYYVIRPEGRRNFGELITLQRFLPDQVAVNLEGQSINLRALKGQWLLVSVASGECGDTCTRHLYMQRQLRESLGKEKDRLDWVWLISDDKPVDAKIRSALVGATALRVPPGAFAGWLAPGEGHQLSDHLYLIDPMGNWMMRFPAGLDLTAAAKAKRDIERVLRASSSWDTAGRQP